MQSFRPSFVREVLYLITTSAEEFQNQIEILPLDEGALNVITVKVTPQSGPYEHASFIFRIYDDGRYPDQPPALQCLTPIFHPNIDWLVNSDNVCLNICSNWSRKFGLKEILHAILFLLNEPNMNDPYNRSVKVPDDMTFKEYIKLSLRGGVVCGVRYPPNETWCKWAIEANALTDATTEDEQPSYKQTHSNSQFELERQVSTNLFRSFAQAEYNSLPSVQNSTSLFTCRSLYGLSCLNMTIYPLSTFDIAMYFSRYYFIEIYDPNNEGYRSVVDRSLSLLPLSENDLPIVVQKGCIQRWHIHYSVDCRPPINFGDFVEISDTVSSNETNSEVCSLALDSQQVEQEEANNQVLTGSGSNAEQIHELQTEQYHDEKHDLHGIEEEEERLEEEVEEIQGSQNTHNSEYNYTLEDESWHNFTQPPPHWLNRSFQSEYERYAGYLKPLWWMMYKTHWPPMFAPGHVYLYILESDLPTSCEIGRASLAQLRADVNYLSKNDPSQSDVILVDSLALSPLSPILNRLVRVSVLDDCSTVAWRSREWLSISWSLNPPSYSHDVKMFSLKGSLPISFLCLLSNWLAYGSRMEAYNCLGYSRRLSSLFFSSVSISCLTPARLCCGSSLLFDGWPLWLAVQTTRWLSSALSGFFNRSQTGMRVGTYFVFTDIDEI